MRRQSAAPGRFAQDGIIATLCAGVRDSPLASNLLSQGANVAHITNLLGHKISEMVTRNCGRQVAQGEVGDSTARS